MEQVKQETIDKWLAYLNVMGFPTTEEELRCAVGVAWGYDNEDGWYVQTTCDSCGGVKVLICDCIHFVKNSTEVFVKEFAKVVAEDLELPLYRW